MSNIYGTTSRSPEMNYSHKKGYCVPESVMICILKLSRFRANPILQTLFLLAGLVIIEPYGAMPFFKLWYVALSLEDWNVIQGNKLKIFFDIWTQAGRNIITKSNEIHSRL